MTALVDVPVDRLVPHPRNVRRDLGDLTELAASIAGIGLLQPLTVAPNLDGPYEMPRGDSTIMVPASYVVIAGHRRLAAAVQAGLPSVPCIVRSDLASVKAQLETMLVENLQRSDLTVMEEADAYAQLELLGVKDAAICKATGRAPKTVRERRLLASLPTPRRTEFESGSLSLECAVKCAKLREQWADDAEILSEIDGAATWQFSSGSYGIDRTIERILDSRKPQPEPEGEEPDDEALDLDGNRAEREAERAKRDADMAARREIVNASVDRQVEWAAEAVREGAVDLTGLMRLAAEDLVENDYDHPALALLGIEPCGEDEDVDDHALRVQSTVKNWDGPKVSLLVGLIVSELLSPPRWGMDEHLLRLVEHLGYEPTADEASLLAGEES